MNDTPVKAPAPMPVGGQVIAVVPQTFEEIQRISNTVIAAGIAPQSLIYRGKQGDSADYVKARNIAAVATVLMAGAELGLPPFVALRSFTVINGRPALYADGNVAVIRKARDRDGVLVCKTLQRGFQTVLEPDGTMSDKSFGWCESTRADTGETYREEFSIEDAKLADLWDPEETTEREVWEGDFPNRRPVKRMVKNDAPWHRYWKKMLMWRATGYCLRWLYADVLGGMPDEYEAREIGALIDVTPQLPPERPTPPSAPPPPAEEEKPEPGVGEGSATKTENEPDPSTVGRADTSDVTDLLRDIDDALATAKGTDQIDELFDGFDVQVLLVGNETGLKQAFELKAKHHERLARIARGAQQTSFLPGDDPEGDQTNG